MAKPAVLHWPRSLLFGFALLSLLAAPARQAEPASSPVATTPRVSPDVLLSQADRDWIATHGPVRLGVPEIEWPPFDMFTTEGAHQGITADYIALLRGRLGLAVEIVKFPSFMDALDALRRGSIDVMGSIALTPERERFALFTLPYIESQPVIITRKDDHSIGALQDLAGKTVAIEKGFASREYLKDLPGITFSDFHGTEQALAAVSLGRANAYVGSLITTTYIIDREAMSNLEVRSAADLPISEIRFAVTSRLPELARLFDHALPSITEEEQAAIRKRWIGVAGLAPELGAILRAAAPIIGALICVTLVVLIWNRRLRRQVVRRRQAEAALAAQMSFQVALLENLPALVAYKDTEARFLGCNRAYEEAFAVRRDQIIGRNTIDIPGFPDAQRVRGFEQDLEVLRTGDGLHCEEQLVFADGEVHDILLWRIPFKLADGTPAGLISITIDVSEQKEAERALADQLSYQRALIDTIPSPIYIKDHDARFIGCNRAYEEAFATTREAIVGKTVAEVAHVEPERAKQFYERDLELLQTRGRAFRADTFEFADGKPHDALYWIHSFDLADGRVGGLVGAFVDVSETKALERQAQDAERRLRDIANSVPGVVYQLRVNPDGSRAYAFMSDGVLVLRGIARDEALRDYRALWDQVLDEDRPGLNEAIQHAVSGGGRMRHEFRIRLPDGTLRWLQSAAEPQPAADGAVVLNGYWIDMTEHREMEVALDEARIAADAANRAKSSFLATMSHEIRTPMNGVLGMLELLSLTRLDDDQRSNVDVIRESGRALLRIVDDILDFSKIEAGMLELHPEPTRVADIVRQVRDTYSGAASGKNLVLMGTFDPLISPAVMVDAMRLRQVLNNFVSNALKFTAEGSIGIDAELVERKDGADIVRFSVSDTGIGISAENQKKLFQPFVQAESDTTRRFGGTGLGLTICRRIADMMGGTITMESAPGRGTTMHLEVPLPSADPDQVRSDDEAASVSAAVLDARRPAPDIAAAAAEGTLVLLADDHSTNRALIKRQINLLGYAAETAEDGKEALERWRSGRFAMIITDCHMPEMDGYELARTIRGLEAGNGAGHTPIIACTANALEGEAEACLAAGMDGYLSKPVELRALLQLLDRWLPLPDDAQRDAPVRQSAPVQRTIRSADGDSPPIDRSKLAELTGGDEQVERDILADFRNVAADDAARLTAAVDSGDCDEIARMAHRLKGASRMVGATSLAVILERIEAAGHSDDRTTIAANREPFLREIERVTSYLVEA
jgi:PAS domain S-box-containing protein